MKSEKSTNKYLEMVKEKCISCGKCTRVCPFLSKYKINLAGFAEKEELAYSCLMCGECFHVCPVKLSGYAISRIHRKALRKDFTSVELIKGHYPFKNKLKHKTRDLYFPGCNFSAFYPRTNQAIIDLFIERGLDFDFDCCSLPVDMTGKAEKSKEARSRLEDRFLEKGVERIVTACPNCYHYFKKTLKIPVISIYKWLKEEGIGKQIDNQIDVFIPCPERREGREILKDIEAYCPNMIFAYSDVNCCGLGGLSVGFEPEISAKLKDSIENENLYSYCATCASRFAENNEVHHIVSVILGLDEEVNLNFFKNSLMTKFYRHK